MVGLLHEGFIVQIVDGDPDAEWLQVIGPAGETGYVQAEAVDWQQMPASEEAPSQFVTSPSVSQIDGEQGTGTGQIATVISGTKLRGGPSTSFNPITKLAEGDQLEIVGSNLDGSWYQANLADGTSGWILAYKVEVPEPTETPAPTATLSLTPTVASTATLTPTMGITGTMPVTGAVPAMVTCRADARADSDAADRTGCRVVGGGSAPDRGVVRYRTHRRGYRRSASGTGVGGAPLLCTAQRIVGGSQHISMRHHSGGVTCCAMTLRRF